MNIFHLRCSVTIRFKVQTMALQWWIEFHWFHKRILHSFIRSHAATYLFRLTLSFEIAEESLKLETMAFSSWFSRFRSSSKSLFNSLLRGASSQNLGAQTSFIAKISSSQNGGRRFLLWSSSVVPFALATGSLAFQFQLQSNPSFCDDSDIHDRCVLCKLFVTLFSFVFVSVSQLAGDICVGAELH